jgi:uncharacterized NAD(P)/FAD-binding protein YdhS
MTRQTIVIIGGGVAGSLLAVQLTRLPGGPHPLDVVVVEPRERLGPGTAYTNDRPEWLLNVRSGGLSAFPEEPNHFVAWLQRQGLADCPNGFCPRQVYGRYIESLVQAALDHPAINGVRLQWLNARAVDARPLPDGLLTRVALDNGQQLEAHMVVLALGNFAPSMPVHPDTGYRHHPHFHANPWTPGALRSIGPDDSVMLIGTGLTSVDVLMALQADGHRGPILAVSRHGRWPVAHTPAPVVPYPNYFATDLAGLQSVGEVLRAVRRRVRQAAAEGYDWRAVIDAIRPNLGHIWASWSLPEQQRFMRHLATLWSTLRHRNPPQNAAVLEEMLRSGRLQVHKGRLRHIEPRPNNQLAVQLRHGHSHHSLTADHVVLCTGPLMDYQRLADPLITSLRQGGQLVPDAMRLGIRTDADGALLSADGVASSTFFTLGPSLRPMWFESTAVPELRKQAADLAKVLAERLAGGREHQSAPLRQVL